MLVRVALHGTITYPTKRTSRKIIDSKVRTGYVSSRESSCLMLLKQLPHKKTHLSIIRIISAKIQTSSKHQTIIERNNTQIDTNNNTKKAKLRFETRKSYHVSCPFPVISQKKTGLKPRHAKSQNRWTKLQGNTSS